MLWDLYQQYRIGQLDKKIDRVQNPKFGRCLFCGCQDTSVATFVCVDPGLPGR
jgi:hypothetical protein